MKTMNYLLNSADGGKLKTMLKNWDLLCKKIILSKQSSRNIKTFLEIS
jgi:hypothetical protein